MMIRDRCRCGDDFCATFLHAPQPKVATNPVENQPSVWANAFRFQSDDPDPEFGTTSEHLREKIGFPITLSDG